MPTNGYSVFTFLDLDTGFTTTVPLKTIDPNGVFLSRRDIRAQADTIIRDNHVLGYAVTEWDKVVDIRGRRIDYRPRRINLVPQWPGGRWGPLSGYYSYPRHWAQDAGMYDHLVPRARRFGRTG